MQGRVRIEMRLHQRLDCLADLRIAPFDFNRIVRQVAANVLIIEYPYKTLSQVKNMLGRFARAQRELSDDVKRQLQELASCG